MISSSVRSAVVDASIVVDLLLRRRSPESVGIVGTALAAPAHLDAEVLHALIRLERRDEIDGERAGAALDRLRRAPIRRESVAMLSRVAWSLRHNLGGYDALYVALARRLICPLITSDRRLAGAPNLGVPVIVAT